MQPYNLGRELLYRQLKFDYVAKLQIPPNPPFIKGGIAAHTSLNKEKGEPCSKPPFIKGGLGGFRGAD